MNLAILVLLFSSHVMAGVCDTLKPEPFLGALFEPMKSLCEAMTAGYEVDPRAESRCNREVYNSGKILCTASITGKRFQDSELEKCGAKGRLASKMQCYSSVGVLTKELKKTMLDTSTACAFVFPKASDVKYRECLLVVGNQYIDPLAVLSCGDISFDFEKLSCVRAIAGKVFSPKEIGECVESPFDEKKLSCFVKSGTPEPL